MPWLQSRQINKSSDRMGDCVWSAFSQRQHCSPGGAQELQPGANQGVVQYLVLYDSLVQTNFGRYPDMRRPTKANAVHYFLAAFARLV